nr:hypothetical protein [Salinivibrio sp. ML290]
MNKVISSGGASKRYGAITTGNHNGTGSVLSDVLLWNIDFSEAK